MSYLGGKTNALLTKHKTYWQDGYYDTRVRTAKQFEFVARYIEQNPVAKGLVERPEEWDASSASRKDLVTDPWPWLLDEDKIRSGHQGPSHINSQNARQSMQRHERVELQNLPRPRRQTQT